MSIVNLRPALHPAPDAASASNAQSIFPGRLAISPEEFADAVGIGRTLVYLELQKGNIPHRRIGRRYVIPLAELDRWLASDGPGAA